MKRNIILLLLIIFIGGFLRLYNLTSVPVALTGDEVAFGYNSFSIIQSLHDEHGNFLPFTFKSFGDYKPPVFVYLLIPFIKFFGLTEFAIRFPVAICGIVVIFLTYLIAKKIFKSSLTSLISTLLIAISPWGIIFSRGGWEANIAMMLVTAGVYFLFKSIDSKKYLYISLIFFSVGFFTYHAEKIVIPLIVAAWVLIYQKDLFKTQIKKKVVLAVFLIFLIPLIIGLIDKAGQSRGKGALIVDYLNFSTKDKFYEQTNLINEGNIFLTNFLWHSKLSLLLTDVFSKLTAYISPANLFVYGDQVGRHSVEDFGVLYTIDAFFILNAIYFYIRKKKEREDYFLMSWLIIGLIPAMLTKDFLHTIRSLVAIVPLYIFEGWGLMMLASKLSSRKFATITFGFIAVLMIINFGRFLESYFIYTPILRADWWQYGYKQMVLTVKENQDRFDNIVVDVPVLYGNPYIFFLFYNQYDSVLYNKQVNREDDLVHMSVPVYNFGKYTFREVYWPDDRNKPKTLFVGIDKSIPKNDINDQTKMKLLKEVNSPKGETIFRIVETY